MSVPRLGSVVGAGLHPAHAMRSESRTKFRRKNPPCASAGHALAECLAVLLQLVSIELDIVYPSLLNCTSVARCAASADSRHSTLR